LHDLNLTTARETPLGGITDNGTALDALTERVVYIQAIVLHTLAALAEFERSLLVEGPQAGLAAARVVARVHLLRDRPRPAQKLGALDRHERADIAPEQFQQRFST